MTANAANLPTAGAGSFPTSREGRQASIVITNYNYERFVGSAIESALAQRARCQVIVVDDGSTDGSLDVISRYSSKVDSGTNLTAARAGTVEVVTQANGGQASAFNAGFERCRTSVVFFLDGDDVLAPDAVETVLEAFSEHPEAARCHFGLDLIDGKGQPLAGGLPEQHRELPRGDLRARAASNPDDVPWQPTSGNAFRAAVLAQLLPMPTEPYRISADHYLSNLSALNGPIVAIDRPLGSYRVHGENADHRTGFDLARARSILERTRTTRSLLIEHGRGLDLAMPTDTEQFRSLSQDALRLASFRSEPRSEHPFPDDRRRPLIAQAIRSAIGRTDLSVARRMLAIVWVGAIGLAPEPLVAPIASRGLTR